MFKIRSLTFRISLATLVMMLLASAAPLLIAEETQPQKVVATTPWTAAFVAAAGHSGPLTVLAPYDLRHPPEYELRPSDIAAVADADLVVFAGYEVMTQKLKAAAGRNDITMLQITTVYTPAVLEKSISGIAERLGTQTEARRNISRLHGLLDEWRNEIMQAGLQGAPVVCHFFQQGLIKSLGFEIAGVFGPGPLEAKQIMQLSDLEVIGIIDNWHNDVGKPLRETMDTVPVVELINFPGHENTRSLRDVLEYNRRQMQALY